MGRYKFIEQVLSILLGMCLYVSPGLKAAQVVSPQAGGNAGAQIAPALTAIASQFQTGLIGQSSQLMNLIQGIERRSYGEIVSLDTRGVARSIAAVAEQAVSQDVGTQMAATAIIDALSAEDPEAFQGVIARVNIVLRHADPTGLTIPQLEETLKKMWWAYLPKPQVTREILNPARERLAHGLSNSLKGILGDVADSTTDLFARFVQLFDNGRGLLEMQSPASGGALAVVVESPGAQQNSPPEWRLQPLHRRVAAADIPNDSMEDAAMTWLLLLRDQLESVRVKTRFLWRSQKRKDALADEIIRILQERRKDPISAPSMLDEMERTIMHLQKVAPDELDFIDEIRRLLDRMTTGQDSASSVIAQFILILQETQRVQYRVVRRGLFGNTYRRSLNYHTSEPEVWRPVEGREVYQEFIEIGHAFNALLKNLPERLTHASHYFAHAPRVGRMIQKKLLGRADVQAGLPASQPFTYYAITPLGFFQVTRNIFPLIRRLMESGYMPSGSSAAILGKMGGSAPDGVPILPRENALGEVLRSSQAGPAPAVSPQVASILLDWLIEVSQFKPWLFAGATAMPLSQGQGVVLSPAPQEEIDLLERWSRKR